MNPSKLSRVLHRCVREDRTSSEPHVNARKCIITPLFPALQSGQRLFQEPPTKSNFLAASLPGPPGENH